nr:MAG TPA: hypothetical protein [Caudoviricetes sp.]
MQINEKASAFLQLTCKSVGRVLVILERCSSENERLLWVSIRLLVPTLS